MRAAAQAWPDEGLGGAQGEERQAQGAGAPQGWAKVLVSLTPVSQAPERGLQDRSIRALRQGRRSGPGRANRMDFRRWSQDLRGRVQGRGHAAIR